MKETIDEWGSAIIGMVGAGIILALVSVAFKTGAVLVLFTSLLNSAL